MHDHSGPGCGCGCGDHGSGEIFELGVDWADADPEEIVCFCHGVTKGRILQAIKNGAYTLPLISVMTQAGRGKKHRCLEKNSRGRHCGPDIAELIRIYAVVPELAKRTGCS